MRNRYPNHADSWECSQWHEPSRTRQSSPKFSKNITQSVFFYLLMACLGNGSHIKYLTSHKLDARKHDDGHGLAFPADHLQDVFGAEQLLTWPCGKFDDRISRIQAMPLRLRFNNKLES